MPTDHINPPGVSTPTGYTHVVSTEARKLVFISGQVGFDANGKIAEGDLAAQAEQVFENLRTCLASVGASFEDVLKMTTFVVNYKPEDRPLIAGARAKHLPPDTPPASTLVGVQALARPEILIEVEAVAALA